MRNASVQALGYMELGVSSLSDWRQYAQQVLGVACVESSGSLDLRYDDQCWRIRLVETGEDDIRCAAFAVASAGDLQAIRARLEAQGVRVQEAGHGEAAGRAVEQLLVCEDPFGLRVELFVGDRVVSDAFVPPRPVAGFVTGAQGLGHIVLAMADQQAAEVFYMGGLGMLLSDHILMGPPGRQLNLTFLHCNPRHHTLAMVPLALPKRLNHFMLQVTSLDDVGCALDAAMDAGVPISSSLGKHTNDRMTSFYMRTPSGFDVEYGYGAIEIDDTTWQPTTHEATSFWGHRKG